ncbi:MAG: HAD family hydrolase [Oscillospiraceae bacterium]|nr:HAD family hydrolase [Oscillospiraceae bacterium]
MRCKAAVFDIDGTLIPLGAAAASTATCRALAEARRAGVTVVIATGRGPTRCAPSVIGDLPFDYLVCVNGACTLAADGALLDSDALSREQTDAVLALGAQAGAQVNLICADGYYAFRAPGRPLRGYAERPGMPSILIDAEAHPPAAAAPPLGGFLLIGADAAEAYNGLNGPLRLVRFVEGHYDICKRTTDKANSVGRLLASLGLSWRDAAAFGDGPNDVALLSRAGLGVSFEDASAQAKAACGLLAPAAAADGAALALAQLLRGGL